MAKPVSVEFVEKTLEFPTGVSLKDVRDAFGKKGGYVRPKNGTDDDAITTKNEVLADGEYELIIPGKMHD
jgi:hypothetical protein